MAMYCTRHSSGSGSRRRHCRSHWRIVMRLALASNYAPDRRPLSEYGYHLAGGLRAAADADELVVLSGRYPAVPTSDVWRVWDDASPHIPMQIVRALRHHRADGLLLNTHFTTWGSNL